MSGAYYDRAPSPLGELTTDRFPDFDLNHNSIAVTKEMYDEILRLQPQITRPHAFVDLYIKENEIMPDNENDAQPAADPKEAHRTPGGQPGDNTPEPAATETTVETPGGTTVTETPADS